MPYMHVRTNVKVDQDKRLSLKKAFGEAISLLPGKSESWLMVDIEDEACLFFAGEGERPLAMVETELLGKSTPAAYEKLTARVCEIMERELPKIGRSIPDIISGPTYKGIVSMNGNKITIAVTCECNEERSFRIQRKLYAKFHDMFERENLPLA